MRARARADSMQGEDDTTRCNNDEIARVTSSRDFSLALARCFIHAHTFRACILHAQLKHKYFLNTFRALEECSRTSRIVGFIESQSFICISLCVRVICKRVVSIQRPVKIRK